MKLRKLAAIAILPLGLMGCSPQGMADLNGAILGAAMGGPLGAVAGVDMVQPNSTYPPEVDVWNNNVQSPIPQNDQDNSDGWVNVQSGDSTILVPNSMRGVYQQ